MLQFELMSAWKIKKKLSKDLITHLLLERGIRTKKEKEDFFNPKIENHESLLKIDGIKLSQTRIKEAIKNQELIFIYGDYDVDGVSATAISYLALKSIGAKVMPYIPHREKEGYGLSKFGLDEINTNGGKLIITVDNGITAIEQAKYCKSLGIDLIISDHHTSLNELPETFSIVHSTKMCGAAVAWSLFKDLIKKDLAHELLQYVALGTVADLIPLVGLSRAFVNEGLKVLNETSSLGLKALILESGLLDKKISTYEIGFILGPRLNAIGRLEHALDALRLLCTSDPLKAARLARLLCDTNTARQKLTEEAMDDARSQIKEDKKIYILASPNWLPGIIGLVAGKVCEELKVPVIAISVGEVVSKGSARSVDGLNITEVLRSQTDLFVNLGGHSGAAGFTIETKNIEKLTSSLDKYFEKNNIKKSKSVLEIDAMLDLKEINFELAKELEKFEPFGIGNLKPIFANKNLKISDIRLLSNGKHLKFSVQGIDAIGFGMGEIGKDLENNQLIDLAYNLEINQFKGNKSLQFKLKDIIF